MPKSREYHRQVDVQLFAQRTALGDAVGELREVEHFAAFRKNAWAVSAAAELDSLGFRTEVAKSGFKTNLVARIDRDVLPETVEITVSTVFDVVAAHGGAYDGWGGTIVPRSN